MKPWLIMGAVLLAGCSTAPDPVLYMLNTHTATPPAAANGPKISLAEIGLPSYARSSLIVSDDGQGRVRLDDNHRWAAAPAEAITAALAQRLEHTLDATVLVQPLPRDYRPAFTIRVVFERLVRTAEGGSAMSGRALISDTQRRDVYVVRFDTRIGAADATYTSYMASVREALTELAGRIGEQIRAAITADETAAGN